MVFFVPSDTGFLNRLQQSLSDKRNQNLVTKTGAHVRVVKELVNECVDDRYTEILFAPELSLRKEPTDGTPFYVRIRDLGDGIEKVATIAIWLEALNPDIVLWDDFEGSAHPTLIRILLNWLAKKPWQVVISTHSIDVLNSLLDVRPSDAKVVSLKKTSEDLLLHQDFTLEELENQIETNQDPRKLVDFLKL